MGTTAVKERPIIFNGEMVRAVLEGRKTQTRRVVDASEKKVLTPGQRRIGFEFCSDPELFRKTYLVKGVPRITVPTRHPDDSRWPWEDCGGSCLYCPYGQPGDRLWVREKFAAYDCDCDAAPLYLKSGCKLGCINGIHVDYAATASDGNEVGRWSPSIHMPRSASRILLEVTGVRVERVQDISEADAIIEGIKNDGMNNSGCPDCGGYGVVGQTPATSRDCKFSCDNPRVKFAQLWDSINAKRGFGWESNPWVWVVYFQRFESEAPA